MNRSVFLLTAILFSSFFVDIPARALEKPVIYPQSGDSSPVDGVVFSKDSSHMVSFNLPGRVTIWDLGNGRSYGEFKLDSPVPPELESGLGFRTFEEGLALAESRTEQTDGGRTVRSEDGELSAEIPNTNAAVIVVRSVRTGKTLYEFGNIRDSIRSMAISKDRRSVYCGSAFSDLAIWDTAGFLKQKIPMGGLLEDRRFICEYRERTRRGFLVKKQVREFVLTDTFTGNTRVVPLESLPEHCRVFGLTPDMGRIILGIFGEKREYMILDAGTPGQPRSFVMDDPSSSSWDMGNYTLSRDGSRIAFLANETDPDTGKLLQTISIFDTASGRFLGKPSTGIAIIYGFSFAPSGDALFISDAHAIHMADIRTGKILKTFPSGNEKSPQQFSLSGNMAVSEDGSLIAMGDAGGSVHIWDVSLGTKIQTLATQSDGISSVLLSPDHITIWSTGRDDGIVRLNDIRTGREIARFIGFRDGEWIVMTPEGHYNASPAGARHLNVRVGQRILSIDSFSETFFNPVLVADVLKGRAADAGADIRKGVLPPPEVLITAPGPEGIAEGSVTLTVRARDMGGGVEELRLFHNGKIVSEDVRAIKAVKTGSDLTKHYTVFLLDGVNTFRAVGFSRDRTESDPFEITVTHAAPAMDVSLHVLAVGINSYKNSAMNLNFARPDALGIAGFFRKNAGTLFKQVEIREMYDDLATKPRITGELDRLKDTAPQDVVLIYLAGHGENIGSTWYFIPHDLTYPERELSLKTQGISSDDLSGFIRNIKAQKILLLIDACKSGTALAGFRGIEDRKALAQLSRSTGVHVVAASAPAQMAAEVKELGHGVFTYALLEGLDGKASGKGEPVTVRKLMAYVEEILPDISRKYRQEAQYPVVDSRGMDFPLAKGP